LIEVNHRSTARAGVRPYNLQVKQLSAFVGQHTFGSIIGNVEGYPKGRYPRCEPVEKDKPIGGSPWNTLDGNFENFIRPQTSRRACALYSRRSVDGRARSKGMTDNEGTTVNVDGSPNNKKRLHIYDRANFLFAATSRRRSPSMAQ
jgi:hypothetical protein